MTETEVKFLSRDKTRAEHLASALATTIGAAKLIERARAGNPAESTSNAKCAAMWLRVAAQELEALE